MDDNCGEWVECMGVASGCCEQEAGVASGSGWNLWVWLLGVVIRRYIDFLILLIPTPLVSVLFCSSIPTFCSFKKNYMYYWCRIRSRGHALYRDASRTGHIRTGPASFKGRRLGTRGWRSQCMPHRVRIRVPRLPHARYRVIAS